MTGELLIGTSGWNYAHWKGPFYPEGTPDSRLLEYYSKTFRSVEINSTFYGLPSERSVGRWRDTVPPDFIFSIKASRFITHVKRLKAAEDAVNNFLGRAALMGEKLGPVLFQTPPGLKRDAPRLADFLQVLPGGFRYAFEFRDPGWLQPDIYKLLKRHAAALCIYDFDGRLSPLEVTSDFVYLRFHGPAAAYSGKYNEGFHREWSKRISAWIRAGTDAYCYFDNDQAAYATMDARMLNKLCADLLTSTRP